MNITILKPQAKQAGGLEKSALRILNAFAERGHRVTWLTTGCSQAPQGVASYALRRSSLFRTRRLELFDAFTADWLQKHPTDVVLGLDRCRRQTHLRAGNGVHAAYLERVRTAHGPLAAWVRSCSPLHRKLLAMEREAFEHPELRKIITNSHMVRAEILERFRVAPSQVEVLHNGVEWNELEGAFARWPEGRAELQRELGLDAKAFHLLFVGHGYERKGLRPLLRGLALLREPNIHLSVVGKDKHAARYSAEAKRLGVRVSFWGARTDLWRFYQMADALAIPSFYDPFANVTVEALAMGLGVISSKYNGGTEVLTPATGLIIDELMDPECIADALRKAVQRPKTWESARAARASVEHLDFPRQLARFVEVCGG